MERPLDLRGEAEEAFRLARAEPVRVWALAAPDRRWEPRHADPETAVLAELALGVAATELRQLTDAGRHLARARSLAVTEGLTELTAEADINLALVLTRQGRLEDALVCLERSPVPPSGALGVRVECQRGLILQTLGRWDQALEAYRRGMLGMRRAGDRLGEARVLTNRGLVHAYAGRFEASAAELRRAERLYVQLGRDLEAAYVRHNQGFVAARQGDIPVALRAFEAAAASWPSSGLPTLRRCSTTARP